MAYYPVLLREQAKRPYSLETKKMRPKSKTGHPEMEQQTAISLSHYWTLLWAFLAFLSFASLPFAFVCAWVLLVLRVAGSKIALFHAC